MSKFDDRYLNYGDVYSIIMQAKTVDQSMNVLHLPYVEMPKWIPVSDGLPKKSGWYLVTWEDQFKTVRGVTVSDFIEPKGLTDIGHFEGFVLREITAWMPLPECYRGESDGE